MEINFKISLESPALGGRSEFELVREALIEYHQRRSGNCYKIIKELTGTTVNCVEHEEIFQWLQEGTTFGEMMGRLASENDNNHS